MRSVQPTLFDLAAGRPLHPFEDPWDLLRDAGEHRLTGLLYARVAAGEIDGPDEWKRALAFDHLAVRGRHARLWEALRNTIDNFRQHGVELATFKGVSSEHRWYDRPGERPCLDVDVLVEPGRTRGLGAAMEILEPGHPLASVIEGLVDRRRLQSVSLKIDDVPIDLHFDLLKLGVATRQADQIWGRLRTLTAPDGGLVAVLDPEVALVHFLLHLNRDRFSALLAFADVARVLEQETLDWDFIDGFSRAQGLEVHVYSALATVTETLGLTGPWPQPGGWRRRVWMVIWRPGTRLEGDVGRLRATRRWFWIPLTARGRFLEAIRWWLRQLLPHPAVAAYRMPKATGPYVWRLLVGRMQHARGRRDRIARIRDTDDRGEPGDP